MSLAASRCGRHTAEMPGAAYESFQATRHFRILDGVRAIAILLVIASHMPERWWGGLNGSYGVTLFFVLSGLLITTLCLREERDTGAVSLRAFYLRRAYRIFPVYYLMLAVTAVLVYTGPLNEAGTFSARQFTKNAPFYLTYLNELVKVGHYRQTWSLGIEEKFYLLWPLLGFVLLARLPRWRIPGAVGLLVLITGLNQTGLGYDFGLYQPILLGCILALLLGKRSVFEFLDRSIAPAMLPLAAAAFVVLHFAQEHLPNGSTLYALGATALFGLGLLRPRWVVAKFLGWNAWKFVAQRSYSMYLAHSIAGRVASVPFGGYHHDLPVPLALLRFLCSVLVSVAFAEMLWRCVERPMIRRGHLGSERVRQRLVTNDVG